MKPSTLLITESINHMHWSPSGETSVLFTRHQIKHRFEGIAAHAQAPSEICHHVQQVHGKLVLTATQNTAPMSKSRPEADGLITTEQHRIAVKTADCLPILVGSTNNSVVAAVHAGWRGFSQGILLETLQLLKQQVQCSNLLFVIGPAISREAFEVGPEVVQALQIEACGLRADNLWMLAAAKGKQDRWHVDLQLAAALQLLIAGVNPDNIEIIQGCTLRDQTNGTYAWNSFRREGRVKASNWSWIERS